MNPRAVSAAQRLRHPVQRLRLYVSALEALGLDGVKAVILYASGSALHVPSVQALCRHRAVPLVGDIGEWYDPRQFPYGRLNPSYHIFQAAFRYAFPRFRNAIVVSNYLRAHFEGDGRHLIRIPSVVDTRASPHVDRTPADRLVLMYAGMPGRKDLLASLLVALAELTDEQRARIEFRLLGPTEDELRRILGGSAAVLSRLGDSVKVLGRVPHERVLAELQQAHFTVLLRPNKRYANAGFPSKVPESLAAGTPILVNFTSDLREYLGDSRGALPVPDCSPATLTAALTRALRLSPPELKELRSQAREKAERYFDYRQYLQPFAQYLEQLQ
jgi:glycosyltransferase involved in cell wall biosynthesis